MNEEKEYEKIIHKIYDNILTHKKYELYDSIFSKDSEFYDGKDKIKGLDNVIRLVSERNQAIPDFKYSIEEILIKGNKAAVRWSGSGKAIKDFAGFKAGEVANYWGISMFHRNAEGLIYNNWQASTTYDV